MYLLGYDIGSSSVKAALVNADSGQCVAAASYPKNEAPIASLHPGWAEQKPNHWWEYLKQATAELLEMAHPDVDAIAAIGISYQMHGLVCVDKEGQPLRDSIIWCDSRAVGIGEQAFNDLGHERCLSHLLNTPGNFTASKLAWVREHEPKVFEKIDKIMLPGDYIALRMTGHATTTIEGLSEGMLWDFQEGNLAHFLLDYYQIPTSMICPITPTFGEQGRLTTVAARDLGLKAGIPVCYRAGDQPNNALSLDVFEPGEVAATAGTSGVVYGVLGQVNYDPLSRVNTFAHVNHAPTLPRLGVLLCINGTGILNAWLHHEVCPDTTYNDMNRMAARVAPGSEGLTMLPFGNGAERVLLNRNLGASMVGLDLVRHNRSHMIRAAHEGIACAFAYGMKIMEGMGMHFEYIRAANANMFRSAILVETLANIMGATIELCETDGAIGAAKGAGIGCGLYADHKEAFASLQRSISYTAEEDKRGVYEELYARWSTLLERAITNQ